jgi:hypothetical protein
LDFPLSRTAHTISGMVLVNDVGHAKATIEGQLGKIAWLRGTGPNPFDYGLWEERTQELLSAIYGLESPEVARYREAAGKRGRLPGVRGQAEDMTLNIHGQWGILGRLERSEAVLKRLIEDLA